MTNKPKKYKNKKLKILFLIVIILLIVVSYVVSSRNKKIDLENILNFDVEEPSQHIRGNINSDIKLVEYSDFQCPACASWEVNVNDLINKYGNDFQLEYRHFPLRKIHPNAQIGAEAAEAAGMQGRFWEMHDLLFQRQKEWSESGNPKRYLKEYAKIIGINVDRFMFDMESDKVKKVVDSQYNEAIKLGLPGTPSFVVDGKKIDFDLFVKENLVKNVEE